MRKLYFSTLLVIGFNLGFSQSAIEIRTVHSPTALVPNGSAFWAPTSPGGTTASDFKIKNVSASTKTLMISKNENVLNPGASAYFCTGLTCYPATTFNATLALAAGEDKDFIVDLEEAATTGSSNITYDIYDLNNNSDIITITMNYSGPNTVKELNLVRSMSNLYPNPASSSVNFNISLTKDANNSTLKIYNSLGSVVSEKGLELNKGANNVSTDVSSLSTGIYFMQLKIDGQLLQAKKITVTK